MGALDLASWFDDPAYQDAEASVSTRGRFILEKLRQLDGARLREILAALYRDTIPDAAEITKADWCSILAYFGANEDEVTDVHQRMGWL